MSVASTWTLWERSEHMDKSEGLAVQRIVQFVIAIGTIYGGMAFIVAPVKTDIKYLSESIRKIERELEKHDEKVGHSGTIERETRFEENIRGKIERLSEKVAELREKVK